MPLTANARAVLEVNRPHAGFERARRREPGVPVPARCDRTSRPPRPAFGSSPRPWARRFFDMMTEVNSCQTRRRSWNAPAANSSSSTRCSYSGRRLDRHPQFWAAPARRAIHKLRRRNWLLVAPAAEGDRVASSQATASGRLVHPRLQRRHHAINQDELAYLAFEGGVRIGQRRYRRSLVLRPSCERPDERTRKYF